LHVSFGWSTNKKLVTVTELAIRNRSTVGVRRDFLIISSTPSFQPDSPLPMIEIDRRILPPEAFCLRKKFPTYIVSALRTGVLLPPEDDLR
jgi:hypothetical protein